MKKKKFITAVLLSFTLLTSGCSIGGLNSVINELHGSLVGNSYTIDTYDNYGNKTLETTGKKISITGNKIETVSYDDTGKAIKGYDLSSVITITIDGKEIESCGDTCIFMQDGLNPEVDFTEEAIQSSSAGLTDNAAVARYINKYKNYFGKSRIVVDQIPAWPAYHRIFRRQCILGNPGRPPQDDQADDRWKGSLHTPCQLPDHRQRPAVKRVPKIIPVICTYYFAEGFYDYVLALFLLGRSMIFAVKTPLSQVKLLAPPVFSAMWRTDWIPIPLPVRLDDWKISFFFRISPSKVFSTWIRSR